MAVLDTLDIKINANAMSAAKSLDTLANSLKKVRSALNNTKKDASVGDKIAKSIHELNNALTRINSDGIKKLNELSGALQNYASAVKNVKGLNISKSTIKSVKDIQDTLETKGGNEALSGETGEVAVEKRIRGLRKLGEEFKAVKKSAQEFIKTFKESNHGLGNFVKALGRIALYRAIRSAIKAVSEAFSEGLKNAYMFSKQSESFTRLAETMDRIKSVTSQMINQLGAFWGEVKQFVLPAIEWIVEKVRSLAQKLTELFAALNGEKTYLFAKYQALEWEEATDNVKKYKAQLLGLDELNNLSTQTGSKKDETDYSQLYDVLKVSDKLLGVGSAWGGVIATVKGYVEELELFLTGAEIAMGAVLLFSGVNPALGLGLLAHGAWNVAEKIGLWDSTKKDIELSLSGIEEVLGGAAAAVGAVLLFSGVSPAWGLGLIISGIGLFSDAKKRKTNWDKIDTKTSEALETIRKSLGIALGVIGAVLLFSGANVGLGLGCLIAGITYISSSAKEKKFSWNKITKKFDTGGLLDTIKGSLVAPIGLTALGAVLLFTGHVGLGIGMLIAGGELAMYEVKEYGWDGVLKNLKMAWSQIKAWVKGEVSSDINGWINDVEKKLHFDLNGDDKIAGLANHTVTSIGNTGTLDYLSIPEAPDKNKLPTVDSITKSNIERALYDSQGTASEYSTLQGAIGDMAAKIVKGAFEDFIDDPIGTIEDAFPSLKNNSDSPIRTYTDYYKKKKAHGGVVSNGSLFWAGESGAEFVGNIGTTSAVANTGQMTEAIYKAAYMGMSQALKENGGNGMNGFIPATTDDLFIAMKKKASNYTKRTGESAFA